MAATVARKPEEEERQDSGIEQQLKEARRRLTLNLERSALATMEERDALVRKCNACQDLGRQKDKLREAMKQQRTRKVDREACAKKAAEEADMKSARLQGVLDKARGKPYPGHHGR